MAERTQGPPHGVGDQAHGNPDVQPGAKGPAVKGLKPAAAGKLRRRPGNILERLKGLAAKRKKRKGKQG